GIVFNETGDWADEAQRAHDVLSMTYIEPWCDHIVATPDQIPAMAEDTPANRQEARFGRGADLRTNALQLLNSAVYGPDGKILDPPAELPPRPHAVRRFSAHLRSQNRESDDHARLLRHRLPPLVYYAGPRRRSADDGQREPRLLPPVRRSLPGHGRRGRELRGRERF